jgi:hypothetical protein
MKKLPAAAALAVVAALVCAPAALAGAPLKISVLSGRADLVSAGNALVRITGVGAVSGVKVTVNGRRRSTKGFATVDGSVEALLSGLKLGRNVVIARATGGRAARIVLTNHPKGGPVIGGPQLQPWVCQESARDKQCNEPATFSLHYMPADGGGFEPYDPASPPSDVATTKTDNGTEMPFIIRVEAGYIDRDRYQIAALFDPQQPWTALSPQKQFNRKLLITHGAGCGADHEPTSPPSVTEGAAETALGKGFTRWYS